MRGGAQSVQISITAAVCALVRRGGGGELDVDRRLQVADEVGGGEVVDRRAAHRVAVDGPIPELDDLCIQAADPRGQACGGRRVASRKR